MLEHALDGSSNVVDCGGGLTAGDNIMIVPHQLLPA